MTESTGDVFDRASGVGFFTPMGTALVQAAGERVLFPAAAGVGQADSVTGIDLAPGLVTRPAADATPFPGFRCEPATPGNRRFGPAGSTWSQRER
jgi:hypothetical protein